MSASPYDTEALRKRADGWRAEAARVTLAAIRDVCLHEAEYCEQQLRRSLATPVLSESEASDIETPCDPFILDGFATLPQPGGV
jgi:hypothetical protein